MNFKHLLLTLFLFASFTSIYAQTDSLILINGDVIIGEVKSMNKSVIVIETDYSDDDFKIEWEGIKEIYTERVFLVNTADGVRYTGTVISSGPNKVIVNDKNGDVELDIADIVFMDKFGNKFLDNFYANIDLGFSLTKANNFTQLTVGIAAGYLQESWSLDLYFNDLRSTQDDVTDIQRTSGGLQYRYLFSHNWYVSAAIDLLSNTEQALRLRTTGKIGPGYFAIRNNVLYWGFGAGANINVESFSNDTPDRNSFEGYFGTELNLFNVTDFRLLTNIYAYPSITESGRWRVDYLLDLKYDMPLDFYIGMNFSFNYDNQPAEVGKELDYVTSLTFGWEW